MKKLMIATAAAAINMALALPAVAQDRPAGWHATGCDGDMYRAIRSERTGEILYWNNRTCPAGSGATDAPEDEIAAPVEPEEPENGDEKSAT